MEQVLKANPGYRLKIVGHSLGGGTASLLAYSLREKASFGGTEVVAFAPGKGSVVLLHYFCIVLKNSVCTRVFVCILREKAYFGGTEVVAFAPGEGAIVLFTDAERSCCGKLCHVLRKSTLLGKFIWAGVEEFEGRRLAFEGRRLPYLR